VQGSKNREIIKPIPNAPHGVKIDFIILYILGLQASGTSNLNHFQYQK
jgi:hypothetical protein